MTTSRVDKALQQVIEAAKTDSEFARKALAELEAIRPTAPNRRTAEGHPQNRRPPGPFDPYEVYGQGGSEGLRQRLGALDVEQLKDIVAEHGMDRSKLAMKWRTSDRLVELILMTVEQRAHKGEAFKS